MGLEIERKYKITSLICAERLEKKAIERIGIVQWYLAPIQPGQSYRIRLEMRLCNNKWSFRWIKNHKIAIGQGLEVRQEEEEAIAPETVDKQLPKLLKGNAGFPRWPMVFKTRYIIKAGHPEVVLDRLYPSFQISQDIVECRYNLLEIEYHTQPPESAYDQILQELELLEEVVDVTHCEAYTNQMIARKEYPRFEKTAFRAIFHSLSKALV